MNDEMKWTYFGYLLVIVAGPLLIFVGGVRPRFMWAKGGKLEWAASGLGGERVLGAIHVIVGVLMIILGGYLIWRMRHT